MNLTERDRYPPLTPTLHSTDVYLIIKAAYMAVFFIMKIKLYKVSSEYLGQSWIVLSTSVKDAASEIIFKTKDTLINIERLVPGVDINMDLRIVALETTSVEVPYG